MQADGAHVSLPRCGTAHPDVCHTLARRPVAPPSPACAAVVVEDAHFAYGNIPVLQGVSFSVPSGSICGLFGPNGSGKTTLFRCILGRLVLGRGTITVDGLNVASMPAANLARHIAYVPQEHRPGFPFLVREIVAMGRTPHMGGAFRLRTKDRQVVARAMEVMHIADLGDTAYTALSGGQRQLVFLARALAQETPLMLLDEPTSALDFSNQMMVWQMLRRIAAQGVTVLVCCHDPNHILWFCDSVAVLHQGRVTAAGPSREILTGALLRTLYGEGIEVCSVHGRPLVRPTT